MMHHPLIVAAEAAGVLGLNLPTLIALVSALSAITAVVVGVFNASPTRKKLVAEARASEANVSYAGGVYIKELSEAASTLVTPLSKENTMLRERILLLEERAENHQAVLAESNKQVSVLYAELYKWREKYGDREGGL